MLHPEPSSLAAMPASRLSRKIAGEVIRRRLSTRTSERKAVLSISRFLLLGAGVTPAQGGVESTEGSTIIKLGASQPFCPRLYYPRSLC